MTPPRRGVFHRPCRRVRRPARGSSACRPRAPAVLGDGQARRPAVDACRRPPAAQVLAVGVEHLDAGGHVDQVELVVARRWRWPAASATVPASIPCLPHTNSAPPPAPDPDATDQARGQSSATRTQRGARTSVQLARSSPVERTDVARQSPAGALTRYRAQVTLQAAAQRRQRLTGASPTAV